MQGECEELGLTVTPGVGNFLLIHFPGKAGLSARQADAFLLSRRIVLRRVDNYHLPDALRMTIGSAQECRATMKALGTFMQQEAGNGEK